MVGQRVRFFSNRVFGAWVDATVLAIGPKYVRLAARFNGVSWTEKVRLDTEFYYPSDHPQRGEAFRLSNPKG